MTHWIRAADGINVTDCWDTPPPAGQDGWREAIEVRPAKTKPDWEQGYGSHFFDLTKTPAEIVWPLVDFPPEEVAAHTQNEISRRNQQVQNQLDAIDLRKVRATTDAILSGDNSRLTALEAQAATLRTQIISSI